MELLIEKNDKIYNCSAITLQRDVVTKTSFCRQN